MAKILPEHELHEKAHNYEIIEKRNNSLIRENDDIKNSNIKLIALVERAHQITLWHKIKEKIFKKPCDICKELEGLK